MARRTKVWWTLACATFLILGGLTANHFRPAPKPRPVPPPADTRDGRWKQDVRYLAEELPRLHGNLFHTLKRADFEAAVQALDAAVPELADDEISVGIARLVAMADDAHAHVFLGAKRLPVVLYWFHDGIFVTAAHPDLRTVLGRKVVRIGRTAIEQAALRAAELVASEGNEGWLRHEVASLLVQPEVLHGLGIVPSADTARFELEDRTGAIEGFDLQPLNEGGTFEWVSAPSGPVAEYRTKRKLCYWFDYWSDSRTLYFQYNSCAEMAGKPFAEFCRELFAVADEQRPERMVVDLRANQGGDESVLSPFLSGLWSRPDLARKERLFVLIGRRTFSSACLHVLEFKRSGRATLAGEPTGGNPFSPFRESMQFSLPNSRLQVGLTWRYVGQKGEGSAVGPDLRVESSSQDYFSGRDPCLEAVLARTPR